MHKRKKTALVTGANRGIGKEIAKQLAELGISVLLGARDENKGREAAHSLSKEGFDVNYIYLDVRDHENILSLPERVNKPIDILVNNAAILVDRTITIEELDLNDLEKTIETNVYGPFLLIKTILPIMKEENYGRIVNVSSGMGSFNEMSDLKSPVAAYSSPAYRLSKAALNVLTILFAKETGGRDILINSMCPGWVRTEMGGSHALLSVEQGAETAIWLATLPENGPSGGFFRKKRLIAW